MRVRWKPDAGVFARSLKEHGISPSTRVIVSMGEKKNWWDVGKKQEWKSRSTLAKCSCGCQNMRVGTKGFYAQSTRCGDFFAKAANPARKAGSVRIRAGITTGIAVSIRPPPLCDSDRRMSSARSQPPDVISSHLGGLSRAIYARNGGLRRLATVLASWPRQSLPGLVPLSAHPALLD